jgi:hypothetical protein
MSNYPIKVMITESEWNQLKPLLTHHGHLSHILRSAIKQFIKENEKMGEKNGTSDKGSGWKEK